MPNTRDTSDTDTTSITVVIVDDHEVVALGLRALLADADGIDVIGTATTCEAAVELVTKKRPDVVLMDYRLPDGTGAETARAFKEAQLGTNVVMITSVADRRVLSQALDAGCCGFLSKNSDRADLVHAITAAAAGESYFTRDMLQHLVHLRRFDDIGQAELSDREVEVLQLTADGMYPEEVAKQLHLSAHTVKNHLRHAMSKLDAHTKLEAVVKAVRARIISLEE
ncbi:response regulator [Ilumatobacter sp.]|uniref:response regulator transcription factor n=1 Tax=Ilumatobacter sp. TaxID=1967498 RepID=UPI0037506B52